MPWNLVDALSVINQRRTFFLPLASIPPERSNTAPVDENLFEITENYSTQPDGRTSDVSLNILCNAPAGGFASDGGLPDPAIRLHAVDSGQISFRPADSVMGDRLILTPPRFAFINTTEVKWWQRWIEADCIPQAVIYENVDRTRLEARLQGIIPEMSNVGGLNFPSQVTAANKANFIQQFLNGAAGHFITAVSGAYIGVAGLADSTANPLDLTLPRLLKLHVRYHNHTDANPHPMNPREFFHLLFGNDSQEAQNHPLLRRIESTGQGQAVQPETRRMVLRPPLRTWRRVEWEADQEINNHSRDWRPAGSLGSDRLFNTHTRDGRSYNQGNYADSNKCNLFVADICLRAGFRNCIHPVGNNRWHYIDANSHTNLTQQGNGNTDRIALQGSNEDRNVTWAWKFENWLRAQPAANRQQLLNEAMAEEGRCFILAGARARRFVAQNLPGGVQGVANCGNSLRRNGIGHIVIVKEFLNQPMLMANAGDGLQQLRVRTMEASGGGAVNRDYNAQRGGVAGAAAGAGGFIRLHLIELHPGQDPDTQQGLRNLNIRNINRNLLGTASERAADRRLTRNPNGTPRTDNQCCHDNHPPRNAAPTEIPCP